MESNKSPKKAALSAITGAFGYSGRYIAQNLLADDQELITLTGHPERHNPFGRSVKAFPFNFDKPDRLVASLEGVQTLYNTYWIRFSHGDNTFEKAVDNTKILIKAARQAGVNRIVHISITNPSKDSPLPYFRGKGRLEEAIIQSGLTYAILRPTVVFGKEDILINNIAYFLRRFPVFVIPGSGEYQIQPIYVGDLAELAVKMGSTQENLIIDAVGPETLTFKEIVAILKESTQSRSKIIHLPPGIALALSQLIGLFVGDIVLTPDEITGLMNNYLVTKSPPKGKTPFRAWVKENGEILGNRYTSELRRHYRLIG